MNSIISWVGGKKALRSLIYQRMPKEFGRYVEVFGGGGWVLFGKPPGADMEVYNDFNADLANLFRCVKERPFALLKELNFLPLNGRDEFNVLKKYLEKEEFTSEYLREELELAQQNLSGPQFEEIKAILMENAVMNDVKRAAAFFKLIRYSYGSGCTSYGCQPFDIRKTFHLIWSGSRRLKDTVIENKDFEALIRQYDRDNAFFIVTRRTSKQKVTTQWNSAGRITRGCGTRWPAARANGWCPTTTANTSGNCTRTIKSKPSAASTTWPKDMITAVNSPKSSSPTTTPRSACGTSPRR